MIKILKAEDVELNSVFARRSDTAALSSSVSDIIANVAGNGDAALREYSLRFDKCELSDIEVPAEDIAAAMSLVEPEYLEILGKAAKNIEDFHRCQIKHGFVVNTEDGIIVGQKVLPIERVGIYVPGGTAAYPSSVLMNCIPAKIAGVSEIIMCTPPSFSGGVNPVILAAAKIAGADRVFRIGGAQAVAAMAYGTESVPKVDKIVGPGRDFVAEAKRQVYGIVGIDMIAGPSEILVIADGSADPGHVAADMLSQAEHDTNASAVLVTTSEPLAAAAAAELDKQLAALPRAEIAGASIESFGKIILVDSIDAAIEISNRLAPEHLEICVDNPFDYLDRVKNAGSIFLGKNCPEALGDYFAGPNHTLPTLGTARFSSPLSVDDFVKRSSFTYYTKDALRAVADDIAIFAEKEGLAGHARSVLSRFSDGEDKT